MELPGRGLQGIARGAESSEWVKSTDMVTTMRATLREGGFKPPFSCVKSVSVLTATTFHLDNKTAEAPVIWPG